MKEIIVSKIYLWNRNENVCRNGVGSARIRIQHYFHAKTGQSLSKFVYPQLVDTDVVKDDQIPMKLLSPTYRRGSYEFGITIEWDVCSVAQGIA